MYRADDPINTRAVGKINIGFFVTSYTENELQIQTTRGNGLGFCKKTIDIRLIGFNKANYNKPHCVNFQNKCFLIVYAFVFICFVKNSVNPHPFNILRLSAGIK